MNIKEYFRQHWMPLAVIALVTLIAYHNTFKSPFIYDDQGNVVDHPVLQLSLNKQIQALYDLKEPYWARALSDRPVTYITLLFNYTFSKLNPTGYHIFNTIVHILVAFLIYIFAGLFTAYLFNNSLKLLPLFVSLIFAVHPVNIESVTYISNRSGELAALFIFLSILAYIKFNLKNNPVFYYVSLVCFIFAMLSKQSAAVLSFIIIIYDYLFQCDYRIREILKRAKYYLPYILITIVYILLYRIFYPEGAAPTEFKTQYPGFTYYVLQPWAFVKFAWMLFYPIGLSIEHLMAPIRILSSKFIISSVLLLAMSIFSFSLYKRKTPMSRIILFCILWVFVNLLPINLFITQLGERHWYLPSFGFAMLSGLGLFYAAKYINDKFLHKDIKFLYIYLGGLYIVVLCILTIQRNALYKDPIKIWEDVIAQYPNNYKAQLNLGVAYSNVGNLDRAIEAISKSISINQYNSDGYTDLGLFYMAKNEYGIAERCLIKAIEINPARPMFYANLGKLYQDRKEYQKALPQYQKALELNPKLSNVHNNLGVIYNELGQQDKAIDYFKKAAELNRNFDLPHFNLANMYSQDTNKYETAKREYEIAVSLNPLNFNAYNNYGLLLKNHGDINEALQAFNRAIAANPAFALAYYNIGLLYADSRDYVNAYAFFKKAVNADPNYCPAYHQLGSIFYNYGQYDEAIKWFLKAIEIDKNYADSYVNLGLAYANLGRFVEAEEMYEKAIKIAPNFALAHNNYAVLNVQLKRYDKAIREYSRAIEIFPQYAEAFNNLGTMWYGLKDYGKAIEYYKKAQAANPSYLGAYLNLALVYTDVKNYREALAEYEKYLKLNPQDDIIRSRAKSIETLTKQ